MPEDHETAEPTAWERMQAQMENARWRLHKQWQMGDLEGLRAREPAERARELRLARGLGPEDEQTA